MIKDNGEPETQWDDSAHEKPSRLRKDREGDQKTPRPHPDFDETYAEVRKRKPQPPEGRSHKFGSIPQHPPIRSDRI